MRDNLSAIEDKILLDLYDKEINNNFEIKISITSYELTEKGSDKLKELVYYINRLSRLNYIETEHGFIHTGGNDHPKYKNNALLIFDDKIHIIDKGRIYVEKLKETKTQKISKWAKKLVSSILKEIEKKLISHVVSFILGMAFFYLIQLLFFG